MQKLAAPTRTASLPRLRRIEEEDLPRHRERFEHYLNENLVGDLAHAQPSS